MQREADALHSEMSVIASETERLLSAMLAESPLADEVARPRRLLEAMRYCSLGGGKRIRPLLVVAAADLFDVPRQCSLHVGAALEMVHCYSLAHDDLPAMDDDDFRRGRASAHKAFDEATAILAGDSLLTLAFDVLARTEAHPSASVRIALVRALARAAGIGGMAGGQMLDLEAEGRYAGGGRGKLGAPAIRRLQEMKTGALLLFAVKAGGILGQADPAESEALVRYGRALGRAFQIADDLLDAEGDRSQVGKAVGKDAAAGKATLVGLLGADGARSSLHSLVAEAQAQLDPFGERAAMLRRIASVVANRQH